MNYYMSSWIANRNGVSELRWSRTQGYLLQRVTIYKPYQANNRSNTEYSIRSHHSYIQLLTLPINYYIRVPFQHIIGTLYPPTAAAAASSCATLPQLANRKENTKIVKKQLNFNYN